MHGSRERFQQDLCKLELTKADIRAPAATQQGNNDNEQQTYRLVSRSGLTDIVNGQPSRASIRHRCAMAVIAEEEAKEAGNRLCCPANKVKWEVAMLGVGLCCSLREVGEQRAHKLLVRLCHLARIMKWQHTEHLIVLLGSRRVRLKESLHKPKIGRLALACVVQC